MAESENLDQEVKISVPVYLTIVELLLQIRMVELEDGDGLSWSVESFYNLCRSVVSQHLGNEPIVIELFISKLPERIRKRFTSSLLNSLSDAFQLVQNQINNPTDISPGEAAENLQQQVQENTPIQEEADHIGSRPISATNKCAVVTTRSGINTTPTITLDDQLLDKQIKTISQNRKIQNPIHHVINGNLTILHSLCAVLFITAGVTWDVQLIDFKLDETRMGGDGDSTEKAKRLLHCILFGGEGYDFFIFDRLERDLLESLNGKNPAERVEKALEHPIFYSERKKLEFIRVIANIEGVTQQKMSIHQKNQGFVPRDYHNWKKKIDQISPGLVKEMEMKAAQYKKQDDYTYSNNLYGLLRFIRNYMEHRAEGQEEMNFTSIFPDLFEDVYMLAKEKNWTSRSEIQSVMNL